MRYWEIIAEKLSASVAALGMTTFRGGVGGQILGGSLINKGLCVWHTLAYDSLKIGRSLRNLQRVTLTLIGTLQKGITIQRIRCAALTLFTPADYLFRRCLFVRR